MNIHRIYVNNNSIEIRPESQPLGTPGFSFDDLSKISLSVFIHDTAGGQPGRNIIIWGESPEKVIKYFALNLKVLVAGGGVVENPEGEILFIFRNGKWDFPKGKPEKQESIEKTAIREVEEECGIGGLKILSKLPDTYHIYFNENDMILKRCIWFHMNTLDWQRINLQKEEGITDSKWLTVPFQPNILRAAYPSVRDLANWFQKHHLPPLRSC